LPNTSALESLVPRIRTTYSSISISPDAFNVTCKKKKNVLIGRGLMGANSQLVGAY